jgi:hypothetical protein
MEPIWNEYRILTGKPEGKRPLGIPRRRRVDNIKTNLGEKEWDGADWIYLALANTYVWEPPILNQAIAGQRGPLFSSNSH